MEIGSHGIVVVGWGDADYSKDQHSCEPHNACLYPAMGEAVERKERTDKVIVDGIDAFDDEGGKPSERAGTPTERPLDIVEWDAAEEAGEDDEGKKGTIGDAHDVIVGVETLYDKYGSNDQTDKQATSKQKRRPGCSPSRRTEAFSAAQGFGYFSGGMRSTWPS